MDRFKKEVTPPGGAEYDFLKELNSVQVINRIAANVFVYPRNGTKRTSSEKSNVLSTFANAYTFCFYRLWFAAPAPQSAEVTK